MFRALADAARDLDPDIVVRPYLSAGITDSAELRRVGVKAYGVLPFPLLADDEARMHGVDERVPLAALCFGTRLVLGAVKRIAGSEQPGPADE
jgi:acetylornithine deacetylase/succinyl-diaminopimelate desuccinylase-like protein